MHVQDQRHLIHHLKTKHQSLSPTLFVSIVLLLLAVYHLKDYSFAVIGNIRDDEVLIEMVFYIRLQVRMLERKTASNFKIFWIQIWCWRRASIRLDERGSIILKYSKLAIGQNLLTAFISLRKCRFTGPLLLLQWAIRVCPHLLVRLSFISFFKLAQSFVYIYTFLMSLQYLDRTFLKQKSALESSLFFYYFSRDSSSIPRMSISISMQRSCMLLLLLMQQRIRESINDSGLLVMSSVRIGIQAGCKSVRSCCRREFHMRTRSSGCELINLGRVASATEVLYLFLRASRQSQIFLGSTTIQSLSSSLYFKSYRLFIESSPFFLSYRYYYHDSDCYNRIVSFIDCTMALFCRLGEGQCDREMVVYSSFIQKQVERFIYYVSYNCIMSPRIFQIKQPHSLDDPSVSRFFMPYVRGIRQPCCRSCQEVRWVRKRARILVLSSECV